MTENVPGAPFVAKVVGKGKVTVPKNVRDLLGLKDGDYAEFAAVRKIDRGEADLGRLADDLDETSSPIPSGTQGASTQKRRETFP